MFDLSKSRHLAFLNNLAYFDKFQNNEPVTIRIRLTGEVSPDTNQFTQFMNIVMKQMLQAMNLKEIRREFYNPLVSYF